MNIILIIFGVLWFSGVIFAAGKNFAAWQRGLSKDIAEESKLGDFLFSIFLSLLAFPVVLLLLWINRAFTSDKRYWELGWTLNYKNPRK